MIRALVEKLPAMITPRWVTTRTQPIAIEDVIAYLMQALDLKINGSSIIEIGGADQVSYLDLMKEYARQRGLKRWMIPVPVLSPRLSSLWLGLVTPVYARVGRELVDSLRNETVVRDRSAADLFSIRPLGFREALTRALANEDREFAETRWSDAFSSVCNPAVGRNHIRPPYCGFAVGACAFFSGHGLSTNRTAGRQDWLVLRKLALANSRAAGSAVWRGGHAPWETCSDHCSQGIRSISGGSKKIQRDHLVRLSAEMRLPGRAWLQFEVEPYGSGSAIRQTAIFDPWGCSDSSTGISYIRSTNLFLQEC